MTTARGIAQGEVKTQDIEASSPLRQHIPSGPTADRCAEMSLAALGIALTAAVPSTTRASDPHNGTRAPILLRPSKADSLGQEVRGERVGG